MQPSFSKQSVSKNQFFLHKLVKGSLATYEVKGRTLEIVTDRDRLIFPYETYNQLHFEIQKAIQAENNDLFLYVSDWMGEGRHIVHFSDQGVNPIQVVNGLIDFLVIDEYLYMLFDEEGLFDENADNQLNYYSENAVVRMKPRNQRIEKVFPESYTHSIVDAETFCYDGQDELFIYYYADDGEERCLMYNLQSRKMKEYKLSNVGWSRASCIDGQFTYTTNNTELLKYDRDMMLRQSYPIFNENTLSIHATGGYQDIAIMVNDNACYLLDK
ncbi:hypothetical protein [Listeria booriae]|uniref:hypothetical protein n=1 Tax=Listeria booriae TaxID=1552123 RepID=UPI0016294974|nr:hypothetical protein [Listeria booriae]MBC1891511.1 hypothetical protein [Listeria booriae]